MKEGETCGFSPPVCFASFHRTITRGVGVGVAMRITLHIGTFTVTIIVKSRNRHSAK